MVKWMYDGLRPDHINNVQLELEKIQCMGQCFCMWFKLLYYHCADCLYKLKAGPHTFRNHWICDIATYLTFTSIVLWPSGQESCSEVLNSSQPIPWSSHLQPVGYTALWYHPECKWKSCQHFDCNASQYSSEQRTLEHCGGNVGRIFILLQASSRELRICITVDELHILIFMIQHSCLACLAR